MRRWTTITIAMLLSLLVSLPAGSAWAGGSKTHVVRPGESIQAAIDAARPGDTILVKPGVYTEALAITTDDLTLQGSRGTVLVPPASADNACTRLFGPIFGPVVDGICALGEINLDTFEVIDPLEGLRISGFVVKGFSGSGIFAVGTEDLRAAHNWAKDNTGYGIFAILSTRPVLAYNKTSGNTDAGLYVGDNQQVDAKVFANTSWDNSIGIFLRDVSHGTAERNHVFGNCSGILLLAGAPGPATEWKIRHNLVVANNKTDCGEEDPVPSGMGILLLGAADNDISKNLVLRNRGEGIEGQGGGIVVVTGGEPGGPQVEPSGNTVRKNVAFRNQPFDISWDGTGSGVVFKGNRCATSQPEGLCD
jgi:nitrous oxidase accessory protein NosD